jgi:RNA polymerase sigma-70 factor, ECF subfamily
MAEMRGELLRALLAGSGIAADADLEPVLDQVLAAARAAWPGVAISDEVFLGHLAGALRQAGASSVEDWLARGTASDLYLACGCALGDPAAIAALDAHYLAGLDPALRRLDLPAPVIDDVKQDVRQRLLVADGVRPPRIADFTGAGNLRGWLRVVAINAARQLLRRAAPAAAELAEVVPQAADDAELELLKAHYREQFRAAFAVALAELSPRDRTLIRQHYLLGLGVGELGARYGVHRGTAARWLERCNRTLLNRTRRALVIRLRVARTDVDSILRLVRSRLEVSIRAALAAEDAPEDAAEGTAEDAG